MDVKFDLNQHLGNNDDINKKLSIETSSLDIARLSSTFIHSIVDYIVSEVESENKMDGFLSVTATLIPNKSHKN